MPTTSAKPLPKNGPKPSFRTIPRAPSNILSTLTSTLNDISSNAASASSSSSDAWQHATRRRRRIISPSSSSPQPCCGSAKCPQDLELRRRKRVAARHRAALQAGGEPAHALLRGAVGEGVGHDAALRLLLQPVVADGG